MGNSISTFQSLNSNFVDIPKIIPFVLTINSSDSIVERYFARLINDVTYTEVSQDNVTDLLNSGFYKTITLNWKVRGIKRNSYINNILDTEGVFEYNIKQINNAILSDSTFKSKISNPLEFYQGI